MLYTYTSIHLIYTYLLIYCLILFYTTMVHRGTETESEVDLRLKNAEIEVLASAEVGLFDSVIVNDDFEAASRAFFRLVRDWLVYAYIYSVWCTIRYYTVCTHDVIHVTLLLLLYMLHMYTGTPPSPPRPGYACCRGGSSILKTSPPPPRTLPPPHPPLYPLLTL